MILKMTHIIFCLKGIQVKRQFECKLEIGKCNSEIYNVQILPFSIQICCNKLNLTFLGGVNLFYNSLEKILVYFS